MKPTALGVRRTRGTRLIGAATAISGLLALAACGGIQDSSTSASGDFPSQSPTIIAAGDPGGGLDQAARQLEASMSAAGVEQRIEIENNGGGGGNPARAAVLKRPNDGHTVVAESNRIFLNPLLGTTEMTVDDFTPLAQLTNDWLVWAVKADSEYQTAKDVLDAVKQEPSSVTFGVGTIPSDDQVNILKAAKESGVEDLKSLNIVSFQSGGDLNTELLGGHVEVVSTGLSEAASLAKAGDIRLLSVSSPKPLPGPAEGVPTWKQLGLNFTVPHWRGIFGPADMPDEAVQWWENTIKKSTESDEWKKQMEKANLTSDFQPGDEFGQDLKQQAKEYESLLREVGLA